MVVVHEVHHQWWLRPEFVWRRARGGDGRWWKKGCDADRPDAFADGCRLSSHAAAAAGLVILLANWQAND